MNRYLWATLPWLGGKRAVVREIMGEVSDYAPGTIFADAFSGSGAVAITAKALGYRVLANDQSPLAEAVGHALIENPSYTLPDELIQYALSTEPIPDEEMPPPEQLSLPKNCRAVLGSMARAARQSANAGEAWMMRAWIAKTALAMATWGMPTMKAGRRAWDELTPGQATQLGRTGRPLAFAMKQAKALNAGVFDNGHINTFSRQDAVSFLGECEADIAYLDPPYPGVTGYETTYIGVSRLLEPEASAEVSAWSAEDGWKLLADAFDAAEAIPVWIVSMGTGAEPDRIMEMMSERSREPVSRSLDHQHMAALKTEHAEGGDELLITGRRSD